MRTQLIRIGNSRGIRIPKPILDQVGLRDKVQLHIQKGRLEITPDEGPRRGWAEAFAAAAIAGNEEDLLGAISNDFDRDEWTW